VSRDLELLIDNEKPSTIDFPSACYREDTPLTLASFEFKTYVLFTIVMVLVPYGLYYTWIRWRRWEHKSKCAADHYSDVTQAIAYTLILFTFGGYAHTFNWIMIVSFYLGLWSYGLLVEVPFMRVSLPGWRIWKKRTWAVMLTALALMLGLAAYHIVLSIRLGIFWPWYICLFILAWLVLLAGVFLARLDKIWWAHRRLVRLQTRRQQLIQANSNGAGATTTSRAIDTKLSGINTTTALQTIDSGMNQSVTNNNSNIIKNEKAAITYRAATTNDKYTDTAVLMRNDSSNYGSNGSQTYKSQAITAANDNNDTTTNAITTSASRNQSPEATSGINYRRTQNNSRTSVQCEPNTPDEGVTNDTPTTIIKASPTEIVGVLEEHPMDPTERLLDGLNVHIHHWQIFLILAFFTRFQDIISQVSAGLVLACFMQGGIAYGFDPMLEPRYTMVVL
jgi:hypothetical protein